MKQCRWPLEARKSKEMASPLKNPEAIYLCQIFYFRFLDSTMVKEKKMDGFKTIFVDFFFMVSQERNAVLFEEEIK